MFELTGRTALVTGASGGIGGAVARALHAQGAQVALTGRNAAALNALAASLAERAHVIEGDLSEAGAADRIIKTAEERMARVDILVNNAGFTRDQLLVRMKDEDWESVLDVNLGAAFRLSRAALRGMMRARWGRIISITSIVGTTGNPGQANYVASKAALAGMSKSLAAEVATRNVTVNCVAPGFIVTAMTNALQPEQRDKLMAAIPSGRFGTPEDVAACVAFLAAPETGYITGQTIHVNGGMAMI